MLMIGVHLFLSPCVVLISSRVVLCGRRRRAFALDITSSTLFVPVLFDLPDRMCDALPPPTPTPTHPHTSIFDQLPLPPHLSSSPTPPMGSTRSTCLLQRLTCVLFLCVTFYRGGVQCWTSRCHRPGRKARPPCGPGHGHDHGHVHARRSPRGVRCQRSTPQ